MRPWKMEASKNPLGLRDGPAQAALGKKSQVRTGGEVEVPWGGGVGAGPQRTQNPGSFTIPRWDLAYGFFYSLF